MSSRSGALLDLAAFAATIAAALQFDWQTPELVWALWLSSLVVGYSLIVYGLKYGAQRPSGPVPSIPTSHRGEEPASSPVPMPKPVRLVAALFMLAFFTFHFGMFHTVHGAFLWAFFPLVPVPGETDFAYQEHLPAIVANGWPLVLGSLVAMRGAFLEARTVFNPLMPYKNVVRMHVLIFVFAFAEMLALEQRWLMIVVLFFYYFPLGSLRSLVRAQAP